MQQLTSVLAPVHPGLHGCAPVQPVSSELLALLSRRTARNRCRRVRTGVNGFEPWKHWPVSAFQQQHWFAPVRTLVQIASASVHSKGNFAIRRASNSSSCSILRSREVRSIIQRKPFSTSSRRTTTSLLSGSKWNGAPICEQSWQCGRGLSTRNRNGFRDGQPVTRIMRTGFHRFGRVRTGWQIEFHIPMISCNVAVNVRSGDGRSVWSTGVVVFGKWRQQISVNGFDGREAVFHRYRERITAMRMVWMAPAPSASNAPYCSCHKLLERSHPNACYNNRP